MGNIRRIKKSLNPGIMLAKTGMSFGGSEVCLVNSDKSKAEAFRGQCLYNSSRSSMVNIYDVLGVSTMLRKRMLAGEPIWR